MLRAYTVCLYDDVPYLVITYMRRHYNTYCIICLSMRAYDAYTFAKALMAENEPASRANDECANFTSHHTGTLLLIFFLPWHDLKNTCHRASIVPRVSLCRRIYGCEQKNNYPSLRLNVPNFTHFPLQIF